MSGLVRKFWDKIDGYTHVRVTWDDIPFENEWGEKFFSQEERDQLSRDFMPWERECRIKGIPRWQRRGVPDSQLADIQVN
jgi:hypothetical protein